MHSPTQEDRQLTTQQPRISVVVVTYNNRDDIDACLRSLRDADECELIVVDNLSTDGTLDHVREHYPTVHAVSAGRNGGFGAGVNYGARLATGTYLAVVNPDAVVQHGWLHPLIDTLETYPRAGLVTPTVLLMGTNDRVNACGNDVHLTGLTFCAGLNQPAPPVETPAQPVAAISGAAFALRRALWEECGGFDERFFMYLEDTDLSLRVRRMGYEVLHAPASRVWHRYEVRVSAAKLYHLERNRLLMLRTNLSTRTLLLLSPALLLTEALTWAFCVQHGTNYVRAKWRSYCRVWREREVTVVNDALSSHVLYGDSSILCVMVSCLSIEQLQGDGPWITMANSLLTRFYACWRRIAVSTTGMHGMAPEPVRMAKPAIVP